MTNIIKRLDFERCLLLVDVGAHKGDWYKDFKRNFTPNKSFYVVGVDPIDYGTGLYDDFYQKACSTQTGKRKFNLFSEPGCNSLLEMRLENSVTDRGQEGWFRPREIEPAGEIIVDCVTLDSILDEAFNDDEVIHFLKVDAQGNDCDVLMSAQKWLPRCMFVQMETCVSKTDKAMMYDGQNTRDSDIEYMKSQGFSLIDEWDHSHVSCPEADLIFKNNRFDG